MEGGVDISQWLPMCNELIDLQLAIQVVSHEVWKLCPALDASKGAAPPNATCDELESWTVGSARCFMLVRVLLTSRRDLLSRSRDTNNNALAPSLVASF